VPVVRLGADEMAQTVGEYCCLAVLAILRDLPRMLQAQAERRWDHFDAPRTARTTRVGIMGLGRIGQATAAMLGGIGFPVTGWSRTAKTVPGVQSCAGLPALAGFLGAADILVAILPDTPDTAGLLHAETLALLPRGAGLVNAGRGSLVVLPDLLAALDSGHLSRAILDVFPTEPLPADDPAWRHERLIVTPHAAGYASRAARAEWVAECIRADRAGQPLRNVFDPVRGY
jgi:glyoxylate/hydroxypyruvate reductase A